MDGTQAIRELLMDALGRQSAFWGLGRITGELYAVLYTSQNPVSLSALAEQLHVTKGNVSVAMHRLAELGMVQRQYHRGDRRVYFVADTDFWHITRSFLERRHHPEFSATFRLVQQGVAESESLGDSADARFLRDRLVSLQHFYDDLDDVTDMLLELDARHLAQIFRSAHWLARRLKLRRHDRPSDGRRGGSGHDELENVTTEFGAREREYH